MNIKFITLTNKGYIKYTLNCLESLERCGIDKLSLTCYCIDQECFSFFSDLGLNAELIKENKFGRQSKERKFYEDDIYRIYMQKFYIIYENLLKYDYVLFTDGDIVFENSEFLDYLIDNIKDNDLLIQEEYGVGDVICSGFMFFRSNDRTKYFMNPDNVKYKEKNWGDQVHINSIKSELKYKKLDLELFPNGKYYMDKYGKINPYMIHFNFLIGNNKQKTIKKYKKWYL